MKYIWTLYLFACYCYTLKEYYLHISYFYYVEGIGKQNRIVFFSLKILYVQYIILPSGFMLISI